MDLQEIKIFIKTIKDTDIEEVLYESNNSSFYIKRMNVKHVKDTCAVDEDLLNKNKILEKNNEDSKKQNIIEIKSTMVGTFISVKNNNRSSFLKEGDNVVIGQKIGQIEAMKIIKDILSNINGKIVKVLITNKQPIEYGQKLFLIDTNSNKK
ncbi:MAG: hypothetical protein LBQ07_01815 [Endomicrobium sp.]|jgi:biotin carboxyl carrier protein|nr:hypothetical protein [Endomicrobium sp.]